MSNKRRKKIIQRKQYRKEKALLLLSYSYFLQLERSQEIKISKEYCNTEYDKTMYKIVKWLKSMIYYYAKPDVEKFVHKRLEPMYKKFYSDYAPSADLLNLGMMFYLLFLEFYKSENISIRYKPPVGLDEVKKFIDWYNDESELEEDTVKFVYRVGVYIDKTKIGLLKFKSMLGSLYGIESVEDILNEKNTINN